MRKKKIALIVCCILSLFLLISGCNTSDSVKDQIVGSWYREGTLTTNRDGGKGPAFTLYDDGTCKIATEYGTGTWAIVNDNQLKLTNFYGETETATIVSIENGCLTISSDDSDNTTKYWNTCQDNN